MSWRLAPSLTTLRAQVNAAWPKRSKLSDGTIGDAAHANRLSDHNPNERGVVCALDITHDPANGCDAGKIAEALRVSVNPRIKYVIFARRIFSSAVHPWEWRDYDGPNPHTKHVHVSVLDTAADDYPWAITRPRQLKRRKDVQSQTRSARVSPPHPDASRDVARGKRLPHRRSKRRVGR